ncbi:TrmB family transcriptional regulator [Halobacteriales archaeon QS_9_70_65]|nr:MAG: TrmB family transcriptional regulator [Halobacteriales archaeon QS_9_70_65]
MDLSPAGTHRVVCSPTRTRPGSEISCSTPSRLYVELLEAPDSTVAELAETVDRDRSNVNRGLSTLREKGLADRQRRLLDSGGHVYQYRATPAEEARAMMHETFEEWADYVHDCIDEFPDD